MTVGEVRLPPLRGCLVWGEMRKLEGSPRIYFAEKRMPGSAEVPLKEHRGGGSGDKGGRGPLAACQGPFSWG
jgi:hypothetical protein